MISSADMRLDVSDMRGFGPYSRRQRGGVQLNGEQDGDGSKSSKDEN
jgi:hypothetical protein